MKNFCAGNATGYFARYAGKAPPEKQYVGIFSLKEIEAFFFVEHWKPVRQASKVPLASVAA